MPKNPNEKKRRDGDENEKNPPRPDDDTAMAGRNNHGDDFTRVGQGHDPIEDEVT